jgi:alpha-L-fucosidase 2
MTREPCARALRYGAPATRFLDSLPLGNGTLGALLDGGLPAETITINHDTLWSGMPGYRDNRAAAPRLPAIRRAAAAGDYRAADNLARGMQGPFTEAYQPAGTVHLAYLADGACSYVRELSLGTAVHDVTSTGSGGAELRRRSFVSAPAGALVHHVSGSRPGSVTMTLHLSSPHRADVSVSVSADAIIIAGRAPSHVEFEPPDGGQPVSYAPGLATGFALALAVRTDGGTVRTEAGRLVIEDADAVVVAVVAGTTFRRWDQPPDLPLDEVSSAACHHARKVAGRAVEDLLAEHVAEHARMFGRVVLRLGASADGGQPVTASTDERLRRARQGHEDPDLAALAFDYGRYLLIASSRPGSQASTLQGIWNAERTPPWNSNWTININTQMNYWPAETTGLPECHEPLIALVEELAVSGRHTARAYYGARGWTAHHNVDIWRAANPVSGGPQWANWAMGGAWLCRHLWQHYEWGRGDRGFLRRIYPVLAGASRFVLDMLTDDGDGGLVVSPATSPEHRFYARDGELAAVTAGTAMDYWITDELFTSTLAAASQLAVSDPLLGQVKLARDRLRRPLVAADGTLLEWAAELREEDPGHRHLSHLYGAYPGAQAHTTARDLRDAARKALRRRLDHGGGTGWSLAWAIALLARFGSGDEAHRQLRRLTQRFLADNLFGLHPSPAGDIFQIDANFGVTAAIAEMLLASHRDSIDVLPALPAAWAAGSVTGLRTRHRVEVGVRWAAGEVTELTLTLRDDVTPDGKHFPVTMPVMASQLVHADTGRPANVHWTADNRIRLLTPLSRDRPSRFIRAGTQASARGG